MKPEIKDQEIIDEMINRFSSITAGSDYYYTPASVIDNRPESKSFSQNDLPALNIRDDSEEKAEDIADVYHDIFYDVEIDIIADAGTNIRKQKADVLKSINQDKTWDGKAFHTEYLGTDRNRVDQMGNKISDATIRIRVHYRKTAWSEL